GNTNIQFRTSDGGGSGVNGLLSMTADGAASSDVTTELGDTEIVLRSADMLGNEAIRTIKVIYDIDSPTIQQASIKGGPTNGAVEVQINATDNGSGLRDSSPIEYSVDQGASWLDGAVTDTGSDSKNLTFAISENGVVWVRAT